MAMTSRVRPDFTGEAEGYSESEYQQWLATHYVPIAGGWHY
jgi:hypothetical protein